MPAKEDIKRKLQPHMDQEAGKVNDIQETPDHMIRRYSYLET